MTQLPHDPLDELASAHLDGMTSPEEARRIEGDPALRARVDRLRGAREAVRLPDRPPDAERRELAVAAALAAADGAVVTSMHAARARRTPAWTRWVAAVAAVLVAALVVPRLVGDDDDGSTTLAAPRSSDDARTKAAPDLPLQDSAGDSTASALEVAPSGGDDMVVGGRTTTTAVDPAGGGSTTLAVVDLGSVADLDALAGAARTELDAPSAPVATPPADPTARDACLTSLRVAGPDGTGTYVLNAVARVGDRDVVVTVTAAPDDSRTLRTYAVSGCTLMDTRSI
jgi:hypothetical protein